MKKVTLLMFATMLLVARSNAQDLYVEPKVNVLLGCATIFNPAIEIGFCDFSAVQFEYMGAYAKEDFLGQGGPFLLNMAIAEYRAYLPGRDHKGFFAGFDMGLHQYKADKNAIPFIANDHDDGVYDWGFGYLLGLNLGYKFLFGNRFGVELSTAFGWQHSQHEQYGPTGNIRYHMNASGEWMLYKGGVILSYRFGQKEK